MAEISERNGEMSLRVYLVVKGGSLDDVPRETMRQEAMSALARHGVTYQRDADSGLLPGARGGDDDEIRIACDSRVRGGVVNAFTVGRLAHPERFRIADLEDALADIVQYHGDVNRTGLDYVVLVSASSLHRHIHRNHECIPSTVLSMFDGRVAVESCLVDRRTLEIAWQPNEPRGKIFLLDRPEPAPPGFVRTADWEADPEIIAIPDGTGGVGGRTLVRSFALERGGYRGGDLPDALRDLSPDDLGLVEVKAADSLPMLVLANKVVVVSAVGGGGNGSLAVNLVLENRTDTEIAVEVPHGLLFEVIDPKAAVQNLAVAGGVTIRMAPRSTSATTIRAFCANHRFASPHGEPVRPTVFRMANPGRTQDEVWADLDSRGF